MVTSTNFKITKVPTAPRTQAIHDPDELIEQLVRISFQQARGENVPLRIFENRIDRAHREYSRQQRAQGAAGSMHSESVERIVIAKPRLHFRDHQVAENSGDQSDHQGGHRFYKSGSRSNRHQSSHRSGNSSQHAGLAISNPFSARPSKRCGGRRKVCCHKSARGQASRSPVRSRR